MCYVALNEPGFGRRQNAPSPGWGSSKSWLHQLTTGCSQAPVFFGCIHPFFLTLAMSVAIGEKRPKNLGNKRRSGVKEI
jgi:hypothetical protein